MDARTGDAETLEAAMRRAMEIVNGCLDQNAADEASMEAAMTQRSAAINDLDVANDQLQAITVAYYCPVTVT